MSIRAVRWAFTAYMLIFLGATTWPGAQLINKATPIILGLPFNLFVIATLIVIALGMFAALYFSEKRSGD